MATDLKHQLARCARVQWALGAVLLVICGVIYAVLIRPTSAQLTQMREQFAASRAVLHGNQAQASNLPEVEKEIERLHQRVERFGKQLPKQQDLAQFINDVTRISQQSSLQKLAWRPDAKPRRTDQFSELPIQFTFSGDFAGVFDFLRRIEQMPRLTRVRKLDIRTRAPGTVDVQLTMAIYFAEE